MPLVYEGRKNSSAIRRLSTPIHCGKLPIVVRVPGSEVIPPPSDERLVERVLEEAGHDDLRSLALARVRRPHVEEVAEPRIDHPAVGVDLRLLELEVLAEVEGDVPPEGVLVLVVERLLVQVADVGVELEVEGAPRLLGDGDTARGRLPRRPGSRRGARRRPARVPPRASRPRGSGRGPPSARARPPAGAAARSAPRPGCAGPRPRPRALRRTARVAATRAAAATQRNAFPITCRFAFSHARTRRRASSKRRS